jgi:glycerol-3-phosphate dehydrogenase (NAD(P)+)
VRLAVLGGGSWGTALAVHARRAGHELAMWVRSPEVADSINERRENPAYLPGVELPAGLRATTSLDEALANAEAAIVAVPSEYCRDVYRRVGAAAGRGVLLVSATKGLETDTLRRMSEVAAAEAPGRALAVLSGPSFALEVAKALPTAVVVASDEHAVAERVQHALATRAFRVYSSEDVTGVELAGAVKNVIAIAAGIVDGLGYGHNTVAALVTRGLAEISRLAVALGGRPDTLAGLAGLGDLVLTCTGALSRNRTLGQRLGRGATLEQASAGIHPEGVKTALAAVALAERHAIDMPIALQMKAVLHAGKAPRQALEELMLRSLKRE